MIINLMILTAIYLALPLMYIMMRNNTVAKKGLILSVTLPAEAQKDPEVQACCQTFRKELKVMFWVLTAVLLPCIFLPWVSVVVTISMVWLLIALVLPFLIYGRGYKNLLTLKRRRGWLTPDAGQTVVELSPMKLPKPLKPIWFIPPMVLSVLPVLSCILDELDPGWALFLIITAVTCLSVTALSLVFYRLIYRQRSDTVDDNQDLTAALTRVRRYNWNKFWLLSAWMTSLYSIAVWISDGSMVWYLIVTLVYTTVLLIASVQTEFAARRAQQRLTQSLLTSPQVDEDEYWLWGQIYYNPNNNHTFVNERVGMGISMNMARPAGKILVGFSVLLLLFMPLIGVWLMVEEFTPVTMSFTSDTVIMEHTGREYAVELTDVTRASLLTELPDSQKIMGTGMENLLKGSFSVVGIGSAKLCLNPHAEDFLLLETKDETYLFSGKPGQAEEILLAWEQVRNA
ncbi:MAG: hypothetical protein KH828_06500 [Clostridiales bacterium]|nr:hypothetical protein [Clostridiales bacterium]